MADALQPVFHGLHSHAEKFRELVFAAERDARIVQQPDVDVIVLCCRGADVLHAASLHAARLRLVAKTRGVL
jgi:hypothetical protein